MNKQSPLVKLHNWVGWRNAHRSLFRRKSMTFFSPIDSHALQLLIGNTKSHYITRMAPSRALYQCTTSLRGSQAPRLLAACRIRNKPSSPPATHPVPHMNVSPSLSGPLAACRRMHSQAGHASQPPDYLSESELEIFNKIKAELDPVRLEVHM